MVMFIVSGNPYSRNGELIIPREIVLTIAKIKLDEKMCPRTLSILTRTVGINTEIGRHRAKLNALINKVIDILDGMER
jgi:hypothetical protein